MWACLAGTRRLPAAVLKAAATAVDAVRKGGYDLHRDNDCAVTLVEIRGPDFKGSLRGVRTNGSDIQFLRKRNLRKQDRVKEIFPRRGDHLGLVCTRSGRDSRLGSISFRCRPGPR